MLNARPGRREGAVARTLDRQVAFLGTIIAQRDALIAERDALREIVQRQELRIAELTEERRVAEAARQEEYNRWP